MPTHAAGRHFVSCQPVSAVLTDAHEEYPTMPPGNDRVKETLNRSVTAPFLPSTERLVTASYC